MTDLTEQWKNGELEEGWYYIELNEPFDKIHKDISYYSLGSFDIEVDSNYIIEVLAPVPSFQEWMRTKYSLDDYKRLSDMRGKIIDKMEESNEDSVKYLRKENQQLKDTISKMCMELVAPDNDMSNGLADYFNQDLILEIHEVLK